MYDGGRNPIGQVNTTHDGETLTIPVTAGLTYYIKAYGVNGAVTRYGLSIVVNAPPSITSLTSSPNPQYAGGLVRLTANGASDPDGNLAEVRFYRDSNNIPELQIGLDTLIGTDSTPADGLWFDFASGALPAGTYTYYAVADDAAGLAGNVVTTTNTLVVDQPPHISSLTDAPDPVLNSATLTLIAVGVNDPDGNLVGVRFYRETTGDYLLERGTGGDTLLGADTDPSGGYTLTVPASGLPPGYYFYYAEAFDAAGVVSPFWVTTVNRVPLPGDANLDDKVDFADLVVVAQNYNGTGKTHAQGDFNFDGKVDFADLVMLAQNYNGVIIPPPPMLLSAQVTETPPGGSAVSYQWDVNADGGSVQDFAPKQNSPLDSGFSAAVSPVLFLKLQGIDGDSPDAQHPKWINLFTFDWVGDQNKPAGQPNLGELHVVAKVSIASSAIMKHALEGTSILTADLAGRKTGDTFDFMTIHLQDVLVSSYKVIDSGDNLEEEFTLAFDAGNVDERYIGPDGVVKKITTNFGGGFTNDYAPAQQTLLESNRPAAKDDIFLQLGTIAGGSTDPDHFKWIALNTMDWGADLPNPGTPGTGRPLELRVAGTMDISGPLLQDAMAKGTDLGAARLAVRMPGDSFDYYTIDLSDARISSYQISSQSPLTDLYQEFSLSFSSSTLTYTKSAAGGGPGAAFVFPWSGTPAAGPGLRQRSILRAGTAGKPLSNFLRLGTIAGESADATHRDWIEVLGFEWAQKAGSANNPAFGQIHVLSWPSIASPKLMEAMRNNTTLPSANLNARQGSAPFDFYTITLRHVQVTSYLISTAPGGSPVEEFTLSFDQEATDYTPTATGGGPGTKVESAWALASAGGLGGSVQIYMPQPASLIDTGFQAEFFSSPTLAVRLDTVPGEFSDARHTKWINVLALDWLAGSNGTGETPNFKDLHVAAWLSSIDPALLGRLATATQLDTADFAAFRPADPDDYFKVHMTGVWVSSYKISSAVTGVPEVEFTLNFQTATVSDTFFPPAGGTPRTATFSYTGPTLDAVPAQRSLLQSGYAKPFVQDYLLHVDNIPGESTNPAHPGWINVQAFEWGGDLAPQITGAPRRFHELRVVAYLDKSGPGLMDALSRATLIPTATLVARSGTDPDYYGLDLTDVRVSSYQISTAPGGTRPVQELTLSFSGFTETTSTFSGAKSSLTHTLASPTLEPRMVQRSLLRAAPPAPGVNLFLRVDGVTGKSTDPNHLNWIELQGVEWGQDQVAAVADKPLFNELHVLMRMTPASHQLLADLLGGTVVPSLNLAMAKVTDSSDFYTIALTNVRVSSYQVTGAASAPLEEFTFTFDADTVPPAVTSAAYSFNTLQALDATFSEDVSETLGADDLLVQNLTTGATIPASAMAFKWDAATLSGHWTFPGFKQGLPDGNYRATISSAGVFDHWGNRLAADVPVDFFVLAGDANHDRKVDFQDLVVLAQNYGRGGGLAQGNFNYDAHVDFADLVILAQQYGAALPAPASAVFSDAPIQAPVQPAPSANAALKTLFSVVPVSRPAEKPRTRLGRKASS
jgi:type VI secretion system secreted protein Hcp